MEKTNSYQFKRNRRWLLAGWLVLVLPALASDDLLVYSDQLNNGWENWGWVPNYTTNNPVHSGTSAIGIAPSAGNQALHLEHDPIDTTLYTNLVLWINGGASGGQTVQVGGYLNGVVQPKVGIGINGKLPTNSWLQVTLPLAAMGCANQTNFNGVGIWSSGPTAQSNFFVDDITLAVAPPPAMVHVSVNATQTVRTVDARVFAVNATAWDSNLDTTNTVAVLTNLNNQALRWPGGSWGDGYHWTNEPNSVGFVNRNWGSFSTNFMHLATNTGAQVFIICNYGSSTPEEAAFGVRMFNVTNHCAFKYWEVGNENYGSWETDNNTNAPWLPHDPWTYAMRFTNYYVQMKAVDPTIKIGAVALDSENAYSNNATHFAVNPRTGVTNYGWTPIVLATLKSLGGTPDFLIDHEYAPAAGDAANLQWAKGWPATAATLRQMLTDYMGPASSNVELNVTENGGSSADRQRCSLVSALFYADSLGQILQTEINTRLWWDLRNGQNAVTNSDPAYYGWRTTADGYPLTDQGLVYGKAEPTNCYPTYYVGKLMKYFARGGDTVIQAGSDHLLLAAYAVKRANGTLTLMVINKSSVSSLNAAISVAGYQPASNALAYSYGIPQDDAARTGVGSPDLMQTNFNGAGVSFTNTFPPYSITVMSLTNRSQNSYAPTLALVTNQTLIAGQTLTITNVATDADVPPQTLTFSLLSPPPGAAINASNGIFTWRPAIAPSPSTNPMSVVVTDSGSPNLSATQSFTITVKQPVRPALTNVSMSSGQFKFTVGGNRGPDYTILASSDLTAWLPLWTNSSPVPPFGCTNLVPTNLNRRFYRVLIGP